MKEAATMLAAVFLFSGCSHFTVGGTMCEQVMADPSQPVPQECRPYDERQAQEASMPPKKKGECIKCSEPEEVEFSR